MEIRREIETDQVFFRTAPGSQVLAMGNLETDGDRVAVTKSPNGRVLRAWVRNALILREAGFSGAMTFRADRKLTFLIDSDAGGVSVEADSDQRTAISLKVARRPRTVLLDGASVRHAYDDRTGMVRLTLPVGSHTITAR